MTRPATVRLVGNSSLTSASPRSLLRALLTYTTTANFVITTELGRDDRVAVLGRISGWGVVRFEDTTVSGEDETAISFKRLGWRVIRGESDLLSRQRIARRGGAQARSTDALFEHRRTKQRVMVCAVHVPNDEGDGAEVARECLERLAEKARRWDADPGIDCVIVGGDFNKNWRLAAVRRELRALFPGAEFTWAEGRAPAVGGTHRGNLIDHAVVYGGTIARASLLADDASSDHRAWRMVVRLP